MIRITQISKEDMEPIVTARTKAIDAATAADKLLKDARLAELEFKVQIQQLYLTKKLDPECKVDLATGNITWPDEDQEPVDEPVVEEPKKRTRGRKAEKSEAE